MANLSGSVGRNGKNFRSDVIVVQRLLNADMPAGKAPLSEDGVFGPKSLAALTEFQRRKGLAQSGLVSSGDPSWVRLGQALTAVRAPSVLRSPSSAGARTGNSTTEDRRPRETGPRGRPTSRR